MVYLEVRSMNGNTWLRGLCLIALAWTIGCQAPDSTETASSVAEPSGADITAPPPGAVYQGEAFTFHEVQPGVYHAVGTGNLTVGCNGSLFVNDEDVLVVDSHITPAAAWALQREFKNITDKPVRFVVNTHFHFDHSHGNQSFGDDVEIVGHSFTRDKLASGGSQRGRAYDMFVGGLPAQIEELESERTRAIDNTDDQLLEEIEAQLEIQRNYLEATESVVPRPPTMTLTKRMTLYRGGREIQLLFFGRGHTGGDVVVYLPEEKVVATGDLLTAGLAYMGDGYLNEWADALDELKKLDFEVVLPGHGEAFRDLERIDHFQAYLRDLWTKIVAKHEAGVSAEEAAETIDMTNHGEHYPSIDGPGVHPHAVERAYALLNGTEQ
jgi:glyoxylase-like metal-dependent hydrolase (beta-lactamase superfamily II)